MCSCVLKAKRVVNCIPVINWRAIGTHVLPLNKVRGQKTMLAGKSVVHNVSSPQVDPRTGRGSFHLLCMVFNTRNGIGRER